MKNFTSILAALGLTAALAFAQRGPGGGHRTPPDPQTMIQMRVNLLASELTLTDDQKTQATQIFTDAFNASQNSRTAIQNARQALDTAVKANNSAGIDNAAAAIGTNEGALTAIQGKADAAFYNILTADQKTKFDAMPHGPGGFGGPGGPGFAGRGRRGPAQN